MLDVKDLKIKKQEKSIQTFNDPSVEKHRLHQGCKESWLPG